MKELKSQVRIPCKSPSNSNAILNHLSQEIWEIFVFKIKWLFADIYFRKSDKSIYLMYINWHELSENLHNT